VYGNNSWITETIQETGTGILDLDFVNTRLYGDGLLLGNQFYELLSDLTLDLMRFPTIYVNEYTSLTDKDGLVQTDRFYFKVTNTGLVIYEKTGLNDPSNPVTLVFNILRRSAGFNLDEFNLDNWKKMAKSREGWKYSFITESSESAMKAVAEILKQSAMILLENEDGLLSLVDLIPPSEDSVNSIIYDNNLFIPKGQLSFQYTESVLPLDYLISSLDTYYGLELKSVVKSDQLSNQTPFLSAKAYLGTSKKDYKLEANYIYDSTTASRVADINMLYHATPIRFLTIQTYGCSFKKGHWVKIQGAVIPNTTGKLYFIMKETSEGFVTNYSLIEFDIDSIIDGIQEVPYPQYDLIIEKVDVTNQLQEVLE
jgi:hypothetical protein